MGTRVMGKSIVIHIVSLPTFIFLCNLVLTRQGCRDGGTTPTPLGTVSFENPPSSQGVFGGTVVLEEG